jgi:SWIM/SEC-C metal-binding protein
LASIGTKKHPAVLRVQTIERAEEIFAFCTEHGIQAIVGVEPDKSEDITDIERALLAREPAPSAPKVGRNEPCPCGSGKKFKKCCEGLGPRIGS